MNRSTRGAVEAQIADAAGKFQREQQGRGPADVRAFVVGDLVIVRCRGIFTPTEMRLTASEQGRNLIRSSRHELRAINKHEIEDLIARIVTCRVVRSFGDVNVEAGEQMEVFILEADLEARLARIEPDRMIRVGAGK